MSLNERLLNAENFLNQLHATINNINIPDSDRIRAATTCFGIARDHHHAVILLIRETFYASGFALLRILFESYLRGLWLSVCSTDTQACKIMEGEKFPEYFEIIKQIEEIPEFNEVLFFSSIKKESWKILCDYTHTGGLHMQRWNRDNAIEPKYTGQEIEEALGFAEFFGAMAVLGIAQLSTLDSVEIAVTDQISMKWPSIDKK
ncbi:MAG: hypothetical protein ABTQ25_06740 [Nitrosomonas ureae]